VCVCVCVCVYVCVCVVAVVLVTAAVYKVVVVAVEVKVVAVATCHRRACVLGHPHAARFGQAWEVSEGQRAVRSEPGLCNAVAACIHSPEVRRTL
jgi:hypothetical protein